MIDKINGEELSNIYRKSLPQALAFIVFKLNEVITEHNKKPIKNNSVQRSLIKSAFLGTDMKLDTNPNIQLSKDKWL